MITNNEMQKAAEFIRNNVSATDFNFSINDSEDMLTRFAQNGITQHISGNKLNVNLSVAFDSKNGQASGNNLDIDSLKYLIKTAQSMAKLNQPDPEFVGSESAHDLPDVNNYAKNTADLPVEKQRRYPGCYAGAVRLRLVRLKPVRGCICYQVQEAD